MFFLALFPSSTGSSLGLDIASCYHVNLVSFNLEHFQTIFFLFNGINFLKNNVFLFNESFLMLGLSYLSSGSGPGYAS